MNANLDVSLESCLIEARQFDTDLLEHKYGCNTNDTIARARLDWIKRQLDALTTKLEALQADIEAGMSLSELGFADPQEMQDLLDDIKIQMVQLKSMAHSLSKDISLGV